MISPENIDTLMEKAQAFTEGAAQRSGPHVRDFEDEEMTTEDPGGDAAALGALNGNCKSCPVNGIC
ncbi:hypothetical protein ACFY00_27815 [Kitasatospora sp. NPDC001540]|uniref:hypothetical protein n=1 Tax=Kitasatospora sp. NPDC001540 TaxID=3364014 RepID=UPI0036ACFFF5